MGRSADEEKIQATAQRVDVGPMVHPGRSFILLRRHVADRAQQLSLLRDTRLRLHRISQGAHLAGQTQVKDLDCSAGFQEQIGGLDIPMDDLVGMGFRQPRCRLQRVVDGHLHVQGASSAHLLKVVAFQVFHDEEVGIPVLPRRPGLYDIRMGEFGNYPGLFFEPPDEFGTGVQQLLDGHIAFHRQVPRPVQNSHASLSDPVQQQVVLGKIEFGHTALDDEFRLKRGQQTVVLQPIAERFRLSRLTVKGCPQRSPILVSGPADVLKHAQQLLDLYNHGRRSLPTK